MLSEVSCPGIWVHRFYSTVCYRFIIIYPYTLTSYINTPKDINTFLFMNKFPPNVGWFLGLPHSSCSGSISLPGFWESPLQLPGMVGPVPVSHTCSLLFFCSGLMEQIFQQAEGGRGRLPTEEEDWLGAQSQDLVIITWAEGGPLTDWATPGIPLCFFRAYCFRLS